MTPSQTLFARELVKGRTAVDALRAAYPDSANWHPETVTHKAERLAENPAIKKEMQRLRDGTAEDIDGPMTSAEAVDILTTTARRLHREHGRPADIVRTVALLARLNGWTQPAQTVDEDAEDGEPDLAAQVRREMGLDE